jgi:hypothetical protein
MSKEKENLSVLVDKALKKRLREISASENRTLSNLVETMLFHAANLPLPPPPEEPPQ